MNTDIIIIGGGIAGLWTLHKVQSLGFKAVLIENNSFGAGQTILSQGIIHGGLKYAIKGIINEDSRTLSNIPNLWQTCFDGKGEIDLSEVEILAKGQYMWSAEFLAAGLNTLFASKSLNSQVKKIEKLDWPQVIKSAKIYGNLYQLNEQVVNVPSLLKALVKNQNGNCIKVQSCTPIYDGQTINKLKIKVDGQEYIIKAQSYIFCAGNGNQEFTNNMQQRPLHMVAVSSKELPTLYGHCLGNGSTPRLTITTHFSNNLPTWYLGGKLAEDGPKYSSEIQIQKTKKELRIIFPKLNLDEADWKTIKVSRAEAKQPSGQKPSNATATKQANSIIAWPTKLALAPMLAKEIGEMLNDLTPSNSIASSFSHFPTPDIAKPFWE